MSQVTSLTVLYIPQRMYIYVAVPVRVGSDLDEFVITSMGRARVWMVDLGKPDVRLSDLLRLCVLAHAQQQKRPVQLHRARA